MLWKNNVLVFFPGSQPQNWGKINTAGILIPWSYSEKNSLLAMSYNTAVRGTTSMDY